MKQILFVGKFNENFNVLNHALSRYYAVQLCSDDLELLKGILKMSRPSVILISVNGLDESNRGLFSYLNQRVMLPVLCIGEKDEIAFFEEFLGGGKIRAIERPILTRELVAVINESIGIPAEEDVQDDKGVEEEKEPQKTILLVDDAAVQLRTMRSILKEDYDVKMTTSGTQAIEILRQSRPDLILLDYDMPGCDGKKTFELIQNEQNGKDVPVVFVTGVKERERAMAVLKLKPAGYLIKPVKREELLEIVQQVLRKNANE